MMDAILLNVIAYANEGKCLYGQKPWTFTRCQEQYKGYQTLVGGFDPSGLTIFYGNVVIDGDGLSGCWNF